MTVDTTGSTDSSVAPYDPDSYGDVGLEDVGAGDVVIPRLQIQHLDGTFKDNLSNAVYPKLKVILLGLVKQRIFWDDDTDDGDKPLCKSPDFENGFPNLREDIVISKRFPWAKSNFEPANFPAENGINGLVTLPCTSCVFEKWDKGDWKVPPCAEQHTYPLLYNTDPEDPSGWTTALFTTAKTGIKPSRTYISSFAQSKVAMFTVHTEIGLTQLSRGTVRYCVPTFRRLEPTDRNDWRDYAEQYRSIRDFIRSAPRKFDEEGGDPPVASGNVNTAPTPAPATAAAPSPAGAAPSAPPPAAPVAPTPASSPSAPVPPTAGNDDLPF